MLEGYIDPRFSGVATSLAKQLPKNGKHGGGALTVIYQGKTVVDIWGGTRNSDGEPWLKDTVATSFSTTKGVASTLLHIIVDKGLADYDDPISRHWPDFAQNGKQHITIRQAMCHEAGLYDIANMIEHPSEMLDWDHMIKLLAQRKPCHTPGTLNAYHGLTYGWLIGGIIEHITGRTFGEVLEEDLIKPLQLDGCFIGIPPSEFHRRADLINHPRKRSPTNNNHPSKPLRQNLNEQWKKWLAKTLYKQLVPKDTKLGLIPKGIIRFDFNDEETVQAQIPAANGMFTARSLATIYAMLANGGQWQGQQVLTPATIKRASQIQNRRWDKVVPVPMLWRLGYHRVFTNGPKTPHAFGHFGFGGSGAWCDPSRELAMAMTLNHGVGTPFGDTRTAVINGSVLKATDRVISAS